MDHTTTKSSTVPRAKSAKYKRIAPVALAVVILASGARTVVAQAVAEQQPVQEQSVTEPKPKWEFLIASGTLVPTGAQRGAIKRANLTAAQLSYVVRPHLAITSTLGWARSRDVASFGTPKLDIFTYDLGAEARSTQWKVGSTIAFSPFAGGGGGARSYISRRNDSDPRHQFAPYLSAGGELSFRPGFRQVHVRLEVRDYMTGLFGQGQGGARNDVVAMVGLRFTKPTK